MNNNELNSNRFISGGGDELPVPGPDKKDKDEREEEEENEDPNKIKEPDESRQPPVKEPPR